MGISPQKRFASSLSVNEAWLQRGMRERHVQQMCFSSSASRCVQQVQ